MEKPVIGILTGPSCTGKSSLAMEWAKRHGQMELISADSILVYRDVNIGSAKPSVSERSEVPHHLVDILDPSESYTAGDFIRAVWNKIEEVESRQRRVLIVGGTGFYLKALLYGLWDSGKAQPEFRKTLENKTNAELYQDFKKVDSDWAVKITQGDRYRLIRALETIHHRGKTPSALQQEMPQTPHPRFELWVMDRDRQELENRIQKRSEAMLQEGLLEEVRGLRERFPDSRVLSSVGYRQACDFLDQKPPAGRKQSPGLKGLIDEISLGTRQLVKRQRTWFRGQASAQWFYLDQDKNKLEQAFQKAYGTS